MLGMIGSATVQPLGGYGSLPGATVLESRIWPSRPWIRTSPPPLLRTISVARWVASRWLSVWALERLAPGFLTSHPPLGLGTTCRLFGFWLFATACSLHLFRHDYCRAWRSLGRAIGGLPLPRRVPVLPSRPADQAAKRFQTKGLRAQTGFGLGFLDHRPRRRRHPVSRCRNNSGALGIRSDHPGCFCGQRTICAGQPGGILSYTSVVCCGQSLGMSALSGVSRVGPDCPLCPAELSSANVGTCRAATDRTLVRFAVW